MMKNFKYSWVEGEVVGFFSDEPKKIEKARTPEETLGFLMMPQIARAEIPRVEMEAHQKLIKATTKKSSEVNA